MCCTTPGSYYPQSFSSVRGVFRKLRGLVKNNWALPYNIFVCYCRQQMWFSTLDKQRICVNTQLKSSKKQLKWNVCVPKSNSNDRYAITCDFIAYHLVLFVSIRLINKCQSGIDFIFTSEHAIYSSFMKISVPSPVFRGKTKRWKWNFAKYTRSECQQGDEICFRNNKIRESDTLERQTIEVNKYASTFRWLHAIRKGLITEEKNVA